MTKDSIEKLEKILNESAEGLEQVTGKRMFGCHTLWADEAAFAMVWKTGRIGVKLTDADQYAALMSLKGAEPWKAGIKTMSHWVLVPESGHKAHGKLREWVAAAHALALQADKGEKKKSPAKKSVAKKTTTKSKTAKPVVKKKTVSKKKVK